MAQCVSLSAISKSREASLVSVGVGMSPSPQPIFFNIKACIRLIRPNQAMCYRVCKACNKKVTEAIRYGYWCEACQKNDEECNLRYIMNAKISDASGEAWISTFNDQALGKYLGVLLMSLTR
ncbi:Replication protein A 70 kDa DNA-binding subunit B [Bienertia sinuspersici]